MAQILIRQLDDDVKARLRRRARRHAHSTEQEVREILVNAVRNERRSPTKLGSRIVVSFAGMGLEGEIGELRDQPTRPPLFEQ